MSDQEFHTDDDKGYPNFIMLSWTDVAGALWVIAVFILFGLLVVVTAMYWYKYYKHRNYIYHNVPVYSNTDTENE